MADRQHSHSGADYKHSVSTVHRSAETRLAHDHEIRVNDRNKIRASWKKPVSSQHDLHKLKPYSRPKTMDAATHKHFEKIVGGMIKAHQERHGLPANYVRKDFHQVAMPAAYRKLKETHFQATTGGKWQKKEK
jgi:hypothetical protein